MPAKLHSSIQGLGVKGLRRMKDLGVWVPGEMEAVASFQGGRKAETALVERISYS